MELNKTILLIGILFLVLPNISAVIISEIMYAPLESEFYNEYIEIYNDGESTLDLTNFTLCGDALLSGYIDHGDLEKLKLNDSIILPKGNYAIITDGGSGTEVYSNFNANTNALALHVDGASLCGGLVNSGETISLKDSSGNLINSVSYDSSLAYNNDKSLQICSDSWIEENPNPGSANSCAVEINNNIGNNLSNNNSEEQKNESTIPTIEATYPLKASLNKEFIFKIKLINFVQDNYDVKIEIFSNGARIAEIMNNNQWKSTTYYLNEIINSNGEKEFIMRVVKEFENADIIIKIKSSNEKIETFQGYNLSINNEELNETYNGTASEIIYLNASLTNQQNSQNEYNKINISNTNPDSKDIKSEENIKKLDKNNYAKYTLTAFIFLLALLFLLKKIFKKKYQNEFKN